MLHFETAAVNQAFMLIGITAVLGNVAPIKGKNIAFLSPK